MLSKKQHLLVQVKDPLSFSPAQSLYLSLSFFLSIHSNGRLLFWFSVRVGFVLFALGFATGHARVSTY